MASFIVATLFLALCPAVPSPAAGLYVAIGDSITSGYGLAAPNRDAFPYLVARRLGVHVVDLGIPGVDTGGAIAFESPHVPRAATIITIFIGTNDADRIRRGIIRKAQFQTQYRNLIATARGSAPSARVYILTPVTSLARSSGVNDFIRRQASSTVRLIDLDHDPLLHRRANYQPDFIHPNVAGQQRIATDVLNGLARSR